MTSANKFQGLIADRVLKGSWLLDPEVDAIIQRMGIEREVEELEQLITVQALAKKPN